MNTRTTKKTGKFLIELFAKESISKSQTFSAAQGTRAGHAKRSPIKHTARCIHHCCSPVYSARSQKTKGPFTNTSNFSTNKIATFTFASIMMSSTLTNAFVAAPAASKTSVVQMAPSLIHRASVSVDDDRNMIFGNDDFEKNDGILDMSASVATTAATSSASSTTSPEQYQFSLRKLLVRHNIGRV